MAGLREDKKRRTRQAIGDVAMRLFAERGFEAVTVNEIAEAAGVAKVTLFKYFPSKESLVLHAVEEDLAGVVIARPPGRSPLRALREYLLAFAAAPIGEADELIARMKVIVDSPALTAAVNRLQYGSRRALARALLPGGRPLMPCETGEGSSAPREAGDETPPRSDAAGDGTSPRSDAAPGAAGHHPQPARAPGADPAALAAELAAAQISAAVLTLQETFFQRVAAGMPPAEAGRLLRGDVDLAFDLLENGLAWLGEKGTT
ncbi:TetR family transcriptional regulator [Microtetraspora malaysiensis]|uniref:TetR family transcriptional regulator n=1 Tax=Microtetraspora malaysiensis TaxID=161358 RepID=UPI000831F0A2|nr:TetR family transcriptional regulator [Microtetraspora malaysiensis]